ncbi:cell wall-associated hydrolase, invasion-associated protein [Thioflavicoccus mobilis 8321]|uniref:Cell wall-associated hydrolase, invasion-associated protein n=1 Tax=Thioflavicoccus mobilis 8321 TaxID=765912 RepID=L0GVU0_9GAMM|nr:C40 family peptidase [Thioflavicoccus mobilis]AGA90888.1 cell wall-associated hydrolase, invasion-associated protein [Thioflavicoccus mobilis 8321]
MRPLSPLVWLGFVGVALFTPGCSSMGSRDEYAGLPRTRERQEVVTAALAQVGTPYVYGGMVPGEGLDCSGLAQLAHLAAGVRIPRVSSEQRRAAVRVVARSPGPGDLVFFRIGPGQYHVGLMIDGDRFVHASTSKGQVLVSRLSTPYWQGHYRGAGSYLN